MRSANPTEPAFLCALRQRVLTHALLTVLLAGSALAPALAQPKRMADSLPTDNKTGFPAGSRQATSGWVKYAGNPVLGGELGTCFDVSVLNPGERFSDGPSPARLCPG